MPVIAQAAKKLRRDRKRTVQCMKVRANVRSIVKKARELRTPKALAAAYKILDKAGKRNIVHHNKAARLKSRLAKLLGKK